MSIFQGPIFILDKATITLDTALSNAAATGFPLSNMDDRVHPMRPYRTSSNPTTTTTTIVFDTGASAPRVNAIFLDNTNVGGWHVSYCGTTGGSYTSWGVGYTGALDALTGRGRVFMDLSDLATNNLRYIKLTAPPQTLLTTPAAIASIGGITVGITGSVMNLPSNGVASLDIQSTGPTVIVDFDGGAREATSIGARFVEITFPVEPYIRESQEAAVLAIMNKDVTPFVIFENADLDVPTVHRAYLVRHGTTKNKLLYTAGRVFTFSMNLIEVV